MIFLFQKNGICASRFLSQKVIGPCPVAPADVARVALGGRAAAGLPARQRGGILPARRRSTQSSRDRATPIATCAARMAWRLANVLILRDYLAIGLSGR